MKTLEETSRAHFGRYLLLLLGCGLLAGACGSTSTGGSPGAAQWDPSDDLDGSVGGLIQAMTRASCHSAFVCEPRVFDASVLTAVWASEERCAEWTVPTIARRPPWIALEQAEARGTLHIDPDAARACVVLHYESCSPDELLESGECRDALVGSLPSGSACLLDAECAGDAYCHFPFHDGNFSEDQCPGECRMRLQPGEACRGSRMCSVGQGVMATCEATAGGAMCGERAILHPAGVGERCGRITADGRYTPCRGGVCRTNDQLNEIGNCVAFRPEGTTCNGEGGPCVPGTWCPLSQAGGSTCERMSFTRNVGTSCDMETSNVFCDLEAGLYCASDKTCQRLGDGSAGSLCSEPWSRIHQSCNEGLFCSESSTSSESTCRARVPAGSPCGSDEECESGQCPYNVVTGQGECAHDYCDPWGAP